MAVVEESGDEDAMLVCDLMEWEEMGERKAVVVERRRRKKKMAAMISGWC